MDVLAQLIGGWMSRQRWYAGKGGVPRLRILQDIPLESFDLEARIRILLLVDDADPRRSVYQVPVVERRTVPAGSESHLIGASGDRALFDGPHDPAFAAALIAALNGGSPRTGPGETASTVMSGEQSNTSIVVSTAHSPDVIVKLFRTVQHGQHPDVELQRALSTARATSVPRFVGSLDAKWQDADGVLGEGQLAVAQEFLPEAEDGWLVARRAVDAGMDFSNEAFALGRATAELHAALAERLPTKRPEPAEVAGMSALWFTRLETAIRDVPSLFEYRGDIQAAYEEAATADWPTLQRIHGDLHLGQVLQARGGGGPGSWVFIDFEGEPLRTIEERTHPEPTLRDLAGMLRSFDYAAASSTDPEADSWARRAGDAYLAGYGEAGGSVGTHSLLTAFELDKAVYEASYEARNRPTWLPIPLRAIERLSSRSLT